jgi:hypothetical protein
MNFPSERLSFLRGPHRCQGRIGVQTYTLYKMESMDLTPGKLLKGRVSIFHFFMKNVALSDFSYKLLIPPGRLSA